MHKRILPALVLGSVLAVTAAACGSSGESAFDDGSSGGASSSGSLDNGSSGGASSGNLGSSGGTDPGELAACATETKTGEALPLDIHIMLDASGSMMAKTGATGNGPTKWSAVKDALKGFIGDAKSAGIGVGLQIFPIVHAGAPATCTSDAQCAGGYGSCFLKACEYTANGSLLPCDTAADCPGNAACRSINQCSFAGLPAGFCLAGSTNNDLKCPGPPYSCSALTQSTCSKKECFLEDYDDARVPIASLPGNASALTSSIDGIANPPQDALTPTSAAVAGGLAYAKQFATANPTHAVVMVLATDGLPTRCAPYESSKIGQTAAAAASGTPSVKTFVIGVFADGEKAAAQPNLDSIAAGGGTGKALIVSTSSNVTADFQKAMDQIRGAALPCEYVVPTPASGTPDYDKINVQYTPGGGGKATVLPQVKGGAAACGTSIGWYYDVDPSSGTPTKITLCPTSCNDVKSGSGTGAKVDVLLGCKTIVK